MGSQHARTEQPRCPAAYCGKHQWERHAPGEYEHCQALAGGRVHPAHRESLTRLGFTMESSVTQRSLGQPGLRSDPRALMAVFRREWTIFRRYPSWIIALFIWPLIFPMMYILTAR